MERSDKKFVDPDPVITWQKIGGGSLYLPKKLIKPGEVFKARASEIPNAFRSSVVALDEVPEVHQPTTEPDITPTETTYTIQPRGKSVTWYDIVDSNGKRINEKALRLTVAEELLRDMLR